MDYEKKYFDAIERLKQWDREHPNGYKVDDRDAFIFPELAESEDDKIRKEIINYFQCQSKEEPTRKKTHNKWIAWLKKQGEQNHAWSEEDERCIRNLIECLEVCVKGTAIKMPPYTALKYIGWLKSLRPQNRWKPSEEHINALSIVVKHGQTDDPDALKELLEQLKKLREE